MKKWLKLILFLFITIIIDNWTLLAQSTLSKKVLENTQYRVTLEELPNDFVGQGKSSGPNFIQFTGYNANDILVQMGSGSITPVSGGASRRRYNCKIENKLNSSIKADDSLMGLLSKPFNFRFEKKQKKIEGCSFVVADKKRLDSARINLGKGEIGIKYKVENGRFYCYECTFDELKSELQKYLTCTVDAQSNNNKISLSVNLNQVEDDLKNNGILIVRYPKTMLHYEISFLK
ncbi:hypothetical protein [Runella slithyformis]|uniref:Uncharacterized protein n=1 Tax=Runella slithyformis (strain ATCC 29530 / DSM 19594 / LMG 11500 / NCIMB 11436 / LSU 4) TaxID=761193 RepID=A0A7U4E6I9_RUNSL|nr:hypothetical protein [Runella slithyformis]AEI49646.1 hypothetical protein Runsl_3271 [Runella slithyformis DSM 19594]